jgi:uncharacterized protein YcbK (DUF882 family)
MQRRQFLRLSAGAVAAASVVPMAPLSAYAATNRRSLHLYDAHNLTEIKEDYWVDGWYNPDVLAKFNYFLRDWRTDETRTMDPGLLDILSTLQRKGGSNEPIHVVCGYRSRATNAMLARRSRGVARNSLHIQGQAADIFMPNMSLARLRSNAMSLQAGGVGYYPRSNFVHVDTGDVRTW